MLRTESHLHPQRRTIPVIVKVMECLESWDRDTPLSKGVQWSLLSFLRSFLKNFVRLDMKLLNHSKTMALADWFSRFSVSWHIRFWYVSICEQNLSKKSCLSGYETFESQRTNGVCKVIIRVRKDLTHVNHQVSCHPHDQYLSLTIKRFIWDICNLGISEKLPQNSFNTNTPRVYTWK